MFGQTKKDHLAEATVCNFLCITLHLTLNLHLLALLFGVEGWPSLEALQSPAWLSSGIMDTGSARETICSAGI